MAEDSLAILPRNMGQTRPGEKKKAEPRKFIPSQRGALITENPQEEENQYTFSDSPAYTRAKKAEDQAKRAAELEGKDETRGFLRSVEELASKQKWEEAFNVLERRTAVPSGLFLVTRAMLRWKFSRYGHALRDAEDALKTYGSSTKAGPLAAAFAAFARLCIGSEVRDKGSCSRELRPLLEAWQQAEQDSLRRHALGQGLFKPRQVERLLESCQPVVDMEADDGSYTAASGLRIGYVLLKNKKDAGAPVVLHFHGTGETAADYRLPALAEKYRDLPVHLLVADYRGYGWSGGEPSLATFLRDAEVLAEKLPELFVQHGFAWPYPGGLILSGRSLGAQVAVHLAAMFPNLFRAMVLDSALAASATGDRLGRAPERTAALARWRKELEQANLEVLLPLDAELWCLSSLDKIRAFDGELLVMHGQQDDLVPFEGSESLHAAAASRQKELVLVKDAGHNDIGKHDEYWTALRRFSLKVQLDNTLPSVGPTLEHLCAVCAEKATSKCGRCQKVWYCGRAHQAEHWKTHKVTCAGGPPEPTPKVVPEAKAVLVALICAEIVDDLSCRQLGATLQSWASQDEPFAGLFVSWYAASEELARSASAQLEEVQQEDLLVKEVQSTQRLSFFEHVKVASALLVQEAPSHAWVSLLTAGSIYSPRYCSFLLPSLRRAAADSRVAALRCSRQARSVNSSNLFSVQEVEASISDGYAQLCQATDDAAISYAVRTKTLQAFIDSTPGPALRSKLCTHRWTHRLCNTFGKKVMEAEVPESEWMCWAAMQMVVDDEDADDALQRGKDFASRNKRLGADSEEAEAARRQDEEKAAAMIAAFRTSLERHLILRAGETVSSKELREMSMDLITSNLQTAGLDQVIGIQLWAKDTAAELMQVAAEKFEVHISDAKP